MLILFSLLLAAAVGLFAYSVWYRAVTEKNPMTIRLRQLRTAKTAGATGSYGERPPLLLGLIARVGGFLPARDGRNALRTGLVRAGYRRNDAVLVFLGCKVLGAALLPILWAGYTYAYRRPLDHLFGWMLLWGVVGFYVPTIFVALKQQSRRDQIVSSLPDSLDLMVICVEAGLGMTAALQRVSSEMRLAAPALSDEFALVHQQMQTGVSRTESLRNLAQRTGVDHIYALVAMLIQTDRLGTSVAQALRAHAESMRTKRRQRAEQMARKAAVKLAFPLVFLILPALLIIILGPAAIEIVKALGADG